MFSYENILHYYYIIILVFCFFFFSALFLLVYHGAFYKIDVKSTKPPFKNDIIVAYKFTNCYSDSRNLLTEAQNIAPQLDSFSIYHENFFQTRSTVGSSVGVVLSESIEEPLCTKLLEAGFKIAVFPSVDYAVVASFPYRNQYSLAIAVYRIYPLLKYYIKMNRLCAHPIMELYTKNKVYFIAPLSKQFDFYAREAIPEYDEESSSEDEDTYLYLKPSKEDSPFPVQNCSLCDPLMNSTCDQCKRAL